ncbi:MAG TPA: hypothetical protein VF889_01655, partial [Bacteroidota bacterium]
IEAIEEVQQKRDIRIVEAIPVGLEEGFQLGLGVIHVFDAKLHDLVGLLDKCSQVFPKCNICHDLILSWTGNPGELKSSKGRVFRGLTTGSGAGESSRGPRDRVEPHEKLTAVRRLNIRLLGANIKLSRRETSRISQEVRNGFFHGNVV